MEIPAQLRCLFSATIEERNTSYVIEVPDQELQLGDLQQGETYHVALLATDDTPANEDESGDQYADGPQEPPVTAGEQRVVEIEDLGEQGDGIARVERGYVVIVPDTERGERVRIKLDQVTPNVAFADVVERLSYYE